MTIRSLLTVSLLFVALAAPRAAEAGGLGAVDRTQIQQVLSDLCARTDGLNAEIADTTADFTAAVCDELDLNRLEEVRLRWELFAAEWAANREWGNLPASEQTAAELAERIQAECAAVVERWTSDAGELADLTALCESFAADVAADKADVATQVADAKARIRALWAD